MWGNTRSSNITSGLPNITGQINSSVSANAIARSVSGVFKNSTSVNTWCMGTEGTWQGNFYEPIKFSAADSNSIYGTTTYVRPQSIGIRFMIKY